MNLTLAPQWMPSLLAPFFSLSYPSAPPAHPDSFPNAQYYSTGILDCCVVLSWLGLLGILREILRLKVFEPFARYYLLAQEKRTSSLPNGVANGNAANGHHSSQDSQSQTSLPDPAKSSGRTVTKSDRMRERSILRFAEQGWPFVYYCTYWPFGMYIHMSLPTSPWSLDNLWIGYPHIPLAAPIKFFYLTQLAFWLHQILILNAEARRNDHWQMMTHHVVTVGLIVGSYAGNYNRVGCLIMVLMDWCDIWLSATKMARYLNMHALCDTCFGIFLLSWLVTRQILFLLVIISAYRGTRFVPFKWDPPAGHYLTTNLYVGFILFLLVLLVLLCLWFLTALQVAYNAVVGGLVDDVRSDDEADSSEDSSTGGRAETKKDQ